MALAFVLSTCGRDIWYGRSSLGWRTDAIELRTWRNSAWSVQRKLENRPPTRVPSPGVHCSDRKWNSGTNKLCSRSSLPSAGFTTGRHWRIMLRNSSRRNQGAVIVFEVKKHTFLYIPLKKSCNLYSEYYPNFLKNAAVSLTHIVPTWWACEDMRSRPSIVTIEAS